jgi:hypothetical protein
MADVEPQFADVFGKLSPNGKKLLNIVSHYPTETGQAIQRFQRDASTYEKITPEQFDRATKELLERDLLKCGKLEEQNLTFVENPDGDRFTMPEDVRKAFTRELLRIKKPGVGEKIPMVKPPVLTSQAVPVR